MSCFVPKPYHRTGTIVLIAQSAQTGRAQHEKLAVDRDVDAQPARGEDARHMPAREEQNVSQSAADPLHDPVCARTDLLWRLAARTAVAEEFPPRTFR